MNMNMSIQEINIQKNEYQKLVHSNIMTLRKSVTLKYLVKINHYPFFIQMLVLLTKILMIFNIS